MTRINSPSELEKFRKGILSKRDPKKPCITLCSGSACQATGSGEVAASLEAEIEKQGLGDKVAIRKTGCHGFCAKAPVIAIEPMGVQYQEVEPGDAGDIVVKTLKENQLIDRLAYRAPKTFQPVFYRNQIPFYAKQERRVLANCGRIDPTNIEHYISAGGYQAIVKALSKMTPDEVIQEVATSKLRGRGGAGVTSRTCLRARPATFLLVLAILQV